MSDRIENRRFLVLVFSRYHLQLLVDCASMCRTMITKRMETFYHPDVVTVNKMCRVLGLEPVSAHSGVRRNLFGVGSGGEPSVDELLSRQMSEISERSARAWNFDFEHEQPLSEGRYMWEKVWQSNPEQTNCTEKPQPNRLCQKENTVLVEVCEDSKAQPKCNKKKTWLVQTSIRSYAKVQKTRRTSKRLHTIPSHSSCKGSKVAEFLLDDVGPLEGGFPEAISSRPN